MRLSGTPGRGGCYTTKAGQGRGPCQPEVHGSETRSRASNAGTPLPTRVFGVSAARSAPVFYVFETIVTASRPNYSESGPAAAAASSGEPGQSGGGVKGW